MKGTIISIFTVLSYFYSLTLDNPSSKNSIISYTEFSTQFSNNIYSFEATTTWYLDYDNDGWGLSGTDSISVDQPDGYVMTPGDCDDMDSLEFPGQIWYQDLDMDGFGDPNQYITSCTKFFDFIPEGTDCNDNNSDEFPGQIWYADQDMDGYGDPLVDSISCLQPSGYVLNNDDCDDTDQNIVPNAYFQDSDGDGFGNIDSMLYSCDPVSGYVLDSTDCADDFFDLTNQCDLLKFCTTWKTDNFGSTSNTQIKFTGVGENYLLEWEEVGNPTNAGDTIISNTAIIDFPSIGIYQVCVFGGDPDFHQFKLNNDFNARKLLTVEQWGGIEWSNFSNAFQGADDLEIVALDVPNLSAVTNFSNAFSSCNNFDSDISNWDVSSGENFSGMFTFSEDFNQDLSSWDLSQAIDLKWMFRYAESFNQDISSWDVSSVDDMREMFRNAESFNQDISSWDVSSVTDMRDIFKSASSFDQNIGDWDIENVTTFNSAFSLTGISVSNYDSILIGWSAQSVQSNISLNSQTLEYCLGEEARNLLIDNFYWNFSGDSKSQELTWYKDEDGDSYGNVDSIFLHCAQLDGYVPDSTDCNDQDASIHPGATEICGDGIDNNCDNQVDIIYWYKDEDGDGYGNVDSSLFVCEQPTNYVTDSTDCDDGDFDLNNRCLDKRFAITVNVVGGEFIFPGLGTNYKIYWEEVGDPLNNADVIGNDFTPIDFPHDGIYKIYVGGGNPAFHRVDGFNLGLGSWGDKLLSIDQWGEIVWSTMEYAFYFASSMELLATDIPNLTNVTNMKSMFHFASSMNSDLSDWDVSNVEDMSSLFLFCSSYDQPMQDWNVEKVENMSQIFAYSAFNQDISSWNTAKVKNMVGMFSNTDFNYPLNSWSTDSVTTIDGIFLNNVMFNQPLNNWNTSNLQILNNVFNGATSFNQDISGWDISSVTSMIATFYSASAFDYDISDWDVSNVTNMTQTFRLTPYNHDLSSWDVSNVESFYLMFDSNTAFNQDLSDWDVSSATDLSYMFRFCPIDMNFGNWDITNVSNMQYMLLGTDLSIANYDSTLIGWADQNPIPNLTLHADSLFYCLGQNARDDLINTYNWTITDEGLFYEVVSYIGPVSGSWNNPANWDKGIVPSTCVDVVIPTGVTLTIDENTTNYCSSLSLGDGAVITLEANATLHVLNP